MERDRWTQLTLHARSLGLLPHNPESGLIAELHEAAALSYADRDLARRLAESQLPVALQVLQRSDNAGRQRAAQDVEKLLKTVQASLVPWIDTARPRGGGVSGEEARDIHRRWEAAFGPLDSPAVQAKIEKLNQSLNQSRYDQLKDLGWLRRL